MPTVGSSEYSNWNFQKYRVQKGVAGGQFVNAESTLIAAGPPIVSVNSGVGAADTFKAFKVYPIGLLETFGLQQSRQLQRIFEIGSSRSYFIPGRTIGSITLGRTFYNGPSLLRAVYAYYSGVAGDATLAALIEDTDFVASDKAGDWRTPGFGNFLIDLASSLFAQPTGMACYFKDANTDTYGGFYLENCYVQGHQMTISSGSVLIMEGASMQYDVLVPLNISAADPETCELPSTTPTQAVEIEAS